MKFKTVSNQFMLGIGYKRSTIYSCFRHSFWLNYGYNTVSWNWNKNPPHPRERDE